MIVSFDLSHPCTAWGLPWLGPRGNQEGTDTRTQKSWDPVVQAIYCRSCSIPEAQFVYYTAWTGRSGYSIQINKEEGVRSSHRNSLHRTASSSPKNGLREGLPGRFPYTLSACDLGAKEVYAIPLSPFREGYAAPIGLKHQSLKWLYSCPQHPYSPRNASNWLNLHYMWKSGRKGSKWISQLFNDSRI